MLSARTLRQRPKILILRPSQQLHPLPIRLCDLTSPFPEYPVLLQPFKKQLTLVIRQILEISLLIRVLQEQSLRLAIPFFDYVGGIVFSPVDSVEH